MKGTARLPQFERFVATYRKIAEARGLNWAISGEINGSIPKEAQWDLGELTGTPKPPSYFLSDFGYDQSTLAVLNRKRLSLGAPVLVAGAIGQGWQELLKAMTVRALFEKRNGARHIMAGILRPIRALATCCQGSEPWELTAEDINFALSTLAKVDKNAKLRSLVEAQIVSIDDNSLSANCPLLGCRSEGQRNTKSRVSAIRKNLNERRRPDRLPGAREFWEILRILLEERPETFYDAIRFGAVELGVLMGLRVEETATVPANPIVIKQYMDVHGQDVIKRGGIGHTMFLRHFSEKQGLRSARSVIYAETSTSVLQMFEDETRAIVDRMHRMTAPLRTRLEAQIRTGRIFPEYRPDEMVSLSEIYPRLTGNPYIYDGPHNAELAEKYRANLDPAVLIEIDAYQKFLQEAGAPTMTSFRTYISPSKNSWIPRRNLNTFEPIEPESSTTSRKDTFGVLISELENAVRCNMPTKLSDVEGFPLEGGRELGIHECLFLVPKRALGEGRNGGVCDVTRYAFVGRLISLDISIALGIESASPQSFFAKYGKPEAAGFTLNSHALRHMHNNELFTAGVADTIITHRFGRQSVAQSHDYDNRTLAQELSDMELPPGTEDLLIGSARDAFKLIAANRGQGRLVEEFRRIQKKEGDEAAIVFLATEADGTQITPYGLCLNSFVMEPCPRHLECFGGCSHLLRTGKATETAQLRKLANRYRTVLESIERHPGAKTAKAKASAQAEARLAAIEQAIRTAPGVLVFPDGADLSRPFKELRISGLIE